MALFDVAKAERDYTPGVYLSDGEILWRVLDLPDERRKGEVPLEDCHFPDAPPIWRPVTWLAEHRVEVIRPA